MVWWFTSSRHALAIRPMVRRWLAGSLLDRLVQVSVPGLIWGIIWFQIMLLSYSANGSDGGAFFLFLIVILPWIFWAVDPVVDWLYTNIQLRRFSSQDEVMLATRCQYLGGHPQLPHGRFAYLLLEGTREDPNLTLGFPDEPGVPVAHFSMPLLDLASASTGKGDNASPGAELLSNFVAAMNVESGIRQATAKLLQQDRLTLVVEYHGEAGSTFQVELANFFGGNEEIRDWRNYLVCAKAEATTGTVPYGSWKSLKPGLPLVQEVSDGSARDGRQPPFRRSAFARR